MKILLLEENAGLTGQIYKGKRDMLLPLMGDVMKCWSQCASVDDFLKKFLFANAQDLIVNRQETSHILTEFFKHADLIKPFAEELDKVFQTQEKVYGKAIADLTKFLNNTGKNGPRIETLQAWIEMMGITGLLHGTTLSATRAACSIQVFQYFHKSEDKFDTKDVLKSREDTFDTKDFLKSRDGIALIVFFATMSGLLEHHVFYSTLVME